MTDLLNGSIVGHLLLGAYLSIQRPGLHLYNGRDDFWFALIWAVRSGSAAGLEFMGGKMSPFRNP